MSPDRKSYPFIGRGKMNRGAGYLAALRDMHREGPRPFYDPAIPTRFQDLELPQIPGVEFGDFSHELDEPLRGRRVTVTHAVAFGGHPAGLGEDALTGNTLRQVIRDYSVYPILGSLVVAYQVHRSSKHANDGRDYFINGEIIPTPEEADRRRITRLGEVMRMSSFAGKPGIFLPLIPAHDIRQQFVKYPIL